MTTEPTPQNREADMPDDPEEDFEPLVEPSNYDLSQCPDVVFNYIAGLEARIKALRADLANKPALDAEVREAVDWATKFAEMKEALAATEDSIDIRDMRLKAARHYRTLIRAASAVQEKFNLPIVTVYDIAEIVYGTVNESTPRDWLDVEEGVMRVREKYPDGFKIVLGDTEKEEQEAQDRADSGQFGVGA